MNWKCTAKKTGQWTDIFVKGDKRVKVPKVLEQTLSEEFRQRAADQTMIWLLTKTQEVFDKRTLWNFNIKGISGFSCVQKGHLKEHCLKKIESRATRSLSPHKYKNYRMEALTGDEGTRGLISILQLHNASFRILCKENWFQNLHQLIIRLCLEL